ncbi:hypothetical protein [Parvibaculum lavamentivorans]|uniref:hypothetical protein n=1 Tax=Parvibaculum lavamentivorans TaxID=256618 RepID=UPI000308BDA9|nr:hypothetical protein [Parvibaculum lavamentivorans]
MTVKIVVPSPENTLFAARIRAALAFFIQIVAGVVAGMALGVNLGSNAPVHPVFHRAEDVVKVQPIF